MRRPVLPANEELRQSWIDWHKVARHSVLISGLFMLILLVILVRNHILLNAIDPLDSPQMIVLKNELRVDSNNDALKEEIRVLDERLRYEYFYRFKRQDTFAGVLTITVALFFMSLRIAWLHKPSSPQPGHDPNRARDMSRERILARRATLALMSAMILCGFTLYVSIENDIVGVSDENVATDEEREVAPFIPQWADMRAQWPRFRGMSGLGAMLHVDFPQEWSESKNIVWKAQLALSGMNSPIIWDNYIFSSGASKTQREVYCVNRQTGKVLWRKAVKDVFDSPEKHPHVEEDYTGYAAPTMACDGTRVFAIFANGDLAAFDFRGNMQWSLNVTIKGNMYGYSSSLLVYKDKLIVLADQDEEASLMAFDCVTGNMLWDVDREYGGGWSSAIISETATGDQLITTANPDVVAYDPDTGKELWKIKDMLGGDIGASAIAVNGMTYIFHMGADAHALTPDGSIAWTTEGSWPDTATACSNGVYAWTLTSPGTISCIELSTGKLLYEKEIDGNFTTSPSVSNNEVLCISEEGMVYILDAGAEFTVKRSFESGITSKASPAFTADGMMYLRSKKNIYAIAGEAVDANGN